MCFKEDTFDTMAWKEFGQLKEAQLGIQAIWMHAMPYVNAAGYWLGPAQIAFDNDE